MMQLTFTIALVAICIVGKASATNSVRHQTKVIDPQKCTSIGVGPKAMIDGST